MKVTEHNVTKWRLVECEINELIRILREEIKKDSNKENQLFYGMILGKLIIMKSEI